LFAIIITGCQKDSEFSQTIGENNEINPTTKAVGGDIIKGDGWIGWIDPELVGGDKIDETEIALGEANMKGEMVEVEGCTSIICNDEGDNCGQILYMTAFGPIPIGLYLLD